MTEKDIVVLFWKDYKHNPNCETCVLDVPEAVDRLRKEGLKFVVDSANGTWRVERPGTVPIGRGIGGATSFSNNNGEVDYYLGVYDRTQTEHMNAMVEAVRYKEQQRNP